ncbi:MAG: hypothetical protein EBT47_07785 [Chloroflexi bacterium]|nr:hypothetical protein [Chloroflexota bacterium]
MTLDVLIRGGRVVDGTGSPWVRADVGITGDRITAIGNLSGASATREIDATGLIVAPGFIDCHSHSDWSLLANRGADSTLMQGVTTEVVGNCGMSYAPVTHLNEARLAADVSRTSPGVQLAWHSFADYLETVRSGGIGANFAFQAGHAAIRSAVMGSGERPATPDEIAGMERHLAQALEEGAIGFSTGLEFVPGRAALRDELLAMAKVVARYDRIHTCHQRTRNEEFGASVDEIVGICEEAGTRLQISHNNKRRGAPDGAWEGTMEAQDSARGRGVDVSCDTTSYIAGLGLMAAVLPPWLFDAGPAIAAERLADPTWSHGASGTSSGSDARQIPCISLASRSWTLRTPCAVSRSMRTLTFSRPKGRESPTPGCSARSRRTTICVSLFSTHWLPSRLTPGRHRLMARWRRW